MAKPETVMVIWTGTDQYSPDYGKLMKGMTLEVPLDVAGPWIRGGQAEEASRPHGKRNKASDKE